MKQKNLLIQRMIILFTMVLFVNFAFAQQTVTGTVTTDENLPLPGANVVVKGTTIGTMSDGDGNYTIEAPQGSTALVFSFIGMGTVELPITGSVVNCTLSAENAEIEEVVVIGYGQVKKNDATGSVSAVSSKDFNKGAITSAQDLLIGKSAGVQIINNGGAPGEGATIRIRGGSSLNASNDPLIVVDGLPLDNGEVKGMRNPLGSINPNDIETFTVLKDASATAIYGSRASNGVILITTKKGKLGKPMKIEYNGVYNYSILAKKASVFSADEFRSLVISKFGAESDQAKLLGASNTDWQNEIYRNTFGHDHNISITGAAKKMPYRVSLGYSDQQGTVKTSSMNRSSVSVGLNPSLFSDHLKFNINAQGTNTKNQFQDGGVIGNAVHFDPTQSVYAPEGSGGYFTWQTANTTGGFTPNINATRNPVALLNLIENKAVNNRLIGNIQTDYKFHFLPDLHANLNLGYDYSKSLGKVKTPETAWWATNPDATQTGGSYNEYGQEKKNQVVDFYLNYVKEISAISSKIDITGGYSWQHFWYKNSSFTLNEAQNDTITPELIEPGELFLISFFGRFNYTIANKYLFTATVRRDGSSRYSEKNRWGLFPAAALAWKIKEETFLKDVRAVSDLKLRLGYGVTGQQDFGGYYDSYGRYTYGQITASYPFGNEYVLTMRPEAYNSRLKWEDTKTYNIGLDYGFKNNRINGSIDLYNRVTENLLVYYAVPAGSGFSDKAWQNLGTLENKGFELSLNLIPVSTKDISWEVGFNLTYNKNKITKIIDANDSTFVGVEVGGISGGTGQNIQINTVDFATNSFYVYEQVYDAKGMPIEGLFVDRNNDGKITEADKYHFKKPAADYFMGFSSRLKYKNFDFSFAGRISLGNYVYDNVSSANGIYGKLYNSAGGDLENISTSVYESNFYNDDINTKHSDFYIKNASFFRMDNISLGYTFNNLAKGKINVHTAVTIQNAFVITPYKGIDPEVGSGIDNNSYPRPRIFLLSLSVSY